MIRAGNYRAGVTIAGPDLAPHPSQVSSIHLSLLYFHGRVLGFQDNPETVYEEIILTRREMECLKWVSGGKSDWEIGEILSIAESTVHTHIENAKTKLHAVTRTQAVVEAMRRGYVMV